MLSSANTSSTALAMASFISLVGAMSAFGAFPNSVQAEAYDMSRAMATSRRLISIRLPSAWQI